MHWWRGKLTIKEEEFLKVKNIINRCRSTRLLSSICEHLRFASGKCARALNAPRPGSAVGLFDELQEVVHEKLCQRIIIYDLAYQEDFRSIQIEIANLVSRMFDAILM
ncbi:hypothetical protein CEXT_236311 [Caerostris extrusa]|uniref:Uncharacterized protein n=1 Tax=Caerostris extrusa TaxID=172846 RepID=A0AAV4XW56_CAEEX|nr:hypothetical protein CEXT_236311 [Caerostris extrusa]